MAVIDDIAGYLEAQGVGTVGTTIFKSRLPDKDITCLVVLDTGGPQPDKYLPTGSPTFQVFIRSLTYPLGKAMLANVRAALHRKFNATLVSGGSYYYYILAQSEGGHLGINEKGFDEFSINFIAKTR